MSDTPELPINPESTPSEPPSSRKKLMLPILIGGAAVLVVIVLGMLLWPNSKEPNVTKQASQFQNWLKPASEIKVGTNRYVSPCSVMPLQIANELLGPLSGETVIQEGAADQSVSEDVLPAPEYKCSYNPVVSGGPALTLEAEEYPDAGPSSIKFAILVDEQGIQDEIDRYQKAIASTHANDKDITSLIQNFKTSLSFFKHATFRTKITDLPKNFILPVSGSLGATNDFAYTWFYKNSVYTLGHSPNIVNSKGKQTAYSDQQIVTELGKISKAYNAAQTNIANPSLDQSPAPTIIGGDTNKYGSTTILEPCAVLTPDVYAKIVGKPQTEAMERTTVSYNFTTKRYTTKGNQLILPRNDCDRHARDAAADSNTYATFELEYGNSASQAQDWLTKNYKVDARDTKLTTTADWAVSFVNPVTPDKYDPVVMFRVGAYIGHVKIYTHDGGNNTEFTTEQYTSAINDLVASLKQNIAHIE